MNPFLSLSLSPSLFSPIYTRLPGRCSLDNKDFRLDSLLFGRLYADNGRFSPLRSTTKLLFTVFPPKLPWNTFQSCNWSAWLFKSIPQHYFYRYLDCKIYTCICFLSVYTCMWMHIYMYIYIHIHDQFSGFTFCHESWLSCRGIDWIFFPPAAQTESTTIRRIRLGPIQYCVLTVKQSWYW